ncbi:MAG: extracellular solute-binding protein [Acholeplasmataceae bacterium]|nr:MAG: extracellular solute-binding protein [Acholeplasmataceae bacterium]
MSVKKILLVVLTITLVVFITVNALRQEEPLLTHAFKMGIEIEGFLDNEYQQYLERHPMERPVETYTLGLLHLEEATSTGYDIIDGTPYGKPGNLILSEEIGKIDFVIDIDQPGYYNLAFHYFPIEGKSSRIERAIMINGEQPYRAAGRIAFSRIWVSETAGFRQDVNGNDVIPRQIEAPRWIDRVVTDSEGLVKGSLLFYLDEGMNTISLEAIKEPILIGHIHIFQDAAMPSYEAYLASHSHLDDDVPSGFITKVQGQDMHEKSSPTLYPIADRTSAINTPQSSFALRANAGGGFNWRVVGDWISYQFEIEEAGFYHISLRAKQSYIRGAYVTRQMRINGQVPFNEADEIPFVYSGNWHVYTLGEADAFKFYFEPGVHEVSFEIVLGDFNEPIREVGDLINTLNRQYREIIMITTAQPDFYRDYLLTQRLPDMLPTFESVAQTLRRISGDLFKMTGESSARTVILDKMALQLENFLEKPETIHRRLAEYQNNVSALGAWILEIKEQPLAIDYIAIHATDTAVERIHANWWESISFSVLNFIASFLIDYNSLSSSADAGQIRGTITVWLGSGRDQANIMRRMIDEDFTERYGIGVNLQLVSMDVLLPAALTRRGPDVAIGVGNQIPVNFAMRNAVHDLALFDDYDIVASRFQESANVPYQYLDGVYALPETQIFPVMFYREDIMAELGIAIPETWEDVIAIIPELQRKNLDFFLPIDIVEQVQGVLPPNLIYMMLLYQNGGQLYLDEGRATGLQERVALDAFKQWTDFYTNYRFQIQANFVNRFRSGEMPIGISYYSMYNTLVVFAPEISGNWAFTTVPGVRQEDGTINNVVPTTGTGIVLMEQSDQKDLGWEFMKWWTEEETQVRFGREMEGILGAAARYPTANIGALEKLPWPARDLDILRAQWQKTVGIPEVPGGYFTGRHLDNALRAVLNTAANPRDTLYEYAVIMNNEITSKRREFDLD